MYYRVAIQVNQQSTWQWKSTVLSSLDALFRFLRLYSALPQDRLRVSSSSSREGMDELLAHVNNGAESNSVTAAQFLQERKISVRTMTREASAPGIEANQERVAIAVTTTPSLKETSKVQQSFGEGSMSSLERRRAELEHGAGGDHDTPYTFALPLSVPQTLAWTRLMARVQRGELES
jgi:hypothetical protein